eukprot:3990636-Prymnesium_polylepis.1
MHGPAAMILATRIARNRSASTHACALTQSTIAGTVGDATPRCPQRVQTNAPWLWAANSV